MGECQATCVRCRQLIRKGVITRPTGSDQAELLPAACRAPSPVGLFRTRAFYTTTFGAAYLGDSHALLRELPDESIDLVVTSPPYALHFKKEYGNVAKAEYISWLKPFGSEILRVLKSDGSFVLNIGGSYNPGSPTRSLYHFKALLMLCEEVGFYLAQEFFWHNPAKLPAPAEWVTVRRQRVKESVEYIWWLSKGPFPKANNRKVLTEYSADMKRLLKRGYKPKQRPSGHIITAKFGNDHGGAIPSNLIERGNNESNSDYIQACAATGYKVHPARFPRRCQNSLSSSSRTKKTSWLTRSPAAI
jgi:DNA modification methylase